MELEKILEEIENERESYEAVHVRSYEKGLRFAAEAIRKHMADDWIPVEERLPGIGRKVLVSFRYTGWQPVIAFLSEEHRWLMLQGMKGYNDVTHDVSAWMPLPKPYHPKSEDWKENLLKKFDKRT